MRTGFCILSTLLCTMQMLWASPGRAQGNQHTTISLHYSHAPLETVFAAIEQKAGLVIMYEKTALTRQPVSISVKDMKVADILDQLLKNKGLQWSPRGNTIRIAPKDSLQNHLSPATFFSPPLAHDIRVHITDSTGSPLQGASVVVKGTKQGGQTDAEGNITLTGLNGGETLVVSYVGYESKEINVGDNAVLTIVLAHIASQLEDMVLKGYYSTTKALNTGSVSTVTAAEIARQPVNDPLMALEGRVPGLYITQNAGIAGAFMNVKLRGQNSIANGNDPLYVIDGVPFSSNYLAPSSNAGGAAGYLSPFATLNMDNIERIEVLKDADATAIYGSRGANGVILITTKKGIAGKTRLNANVYSGAGKVASKLDIMNTAEYLETRRKALANDGITGPSTSKDLNGTYGDVNKYTDWQKVFIGGTSHLTDANASISGGSAQTQFVIGGGYRRETSVFPGNYHDKKASFNSNISHSAGRFKSNLSISYSNDNNQLPTEDYTKKILLAPNAPDLYTNEGKFNWQNSAWINPLWSTTQRSKTITENSNMALNLGYEVFDGLNVNVRGGYNDIKTEFTIPNAYLDYNPAVTILPSYRNISYGNSRIKTYIIEPSISYSKNVGKGKIESLVGTTFQQTDQNSLYGYASGFSSVSLVNNIAAATTKSITGFTNTRYRYNAIYGRIAYNYQDQYLINLTGRRDGSSRFGPGRQFASFGAIGAAWIFSKEKIFEQNLSFISFGKLRASYGSTGNDQIADYAFLSTYTPGSADYQGTNTANPTSLTNPDFGWETVRKLEAGMELGFLKDQILVNAGWYRNRTGNQLVGYGLPGITGFTSVQANLPAVIQNTGIEFDFTAYVIDKSQFKWTVSGNLSIPRNKLVSYPNIEASSYATRYIVGQPLFITFLYHYTGIDPTTKVYTFEDFDNSGDITYEKDRIPKVIGQKYFGGLNNEFTYSGFQLDVFFQFVKQNGYKLVGIMPGTFNETAANQLREVTNEVNSGTRQNYTTLFGSDAGIANMLYTGSDALLTDASFIRLKNISLSWSLPQKYLRTLKLNNARIYLQAQNLLTFTGFKGFDPEVSAGALATAQLRLPPLRMITAGLQFSL